MSVLVMSVSKNDKFSEKNPRNKTKIVPENLNAKLTAVIVTII